MRNYRTISDIEEECLRNHPEEVDDYINMLFDEYAENNDTASLLSFLRVVSRVKGVSRIAFSLSYLVMLIETRIMKSSRNKLHWVCIACYFGVRR